MAENDQEHEQDAFHESYEYDDMDAGSEHETASSEEIHNPAPSGSMLEKLPFDKEMLVRIAYIVFACMAILVIYKVLTSIFHSQPPQKAVAVQQPVFKPQPIAALPPAVSPSAVSPDIAQKLSALQATEDQFTNNFSNLNDQVAGVGTTVTDLTHKVDQLSQAVNVLAAQLAEQSRQITLLTARQHEYVRVKKMKVHAQPAGQKVVYFLQAVIPGRAWIISNLGNTLTVRDCSRIPNYGIVKRIDPNAGRVLTSSGRVIVFSQLDS